MEKAFNKKVENWQITTNRFVAFIDIMGFKDMVAKLSHSQIYRIMKAIDKAKTLNSSTSYDVENSDLIRSTTYSDSIMLYSRDKSENSFDAIVTAISGLTNDLFIEQIPHKGALAYGLMTLDTERSIFFGQPLIDAHLLQEELHFYGIIIHGTVEAKARTGLKTNPFIISYDCPLKNGKSQHYTIYPMHVDGQSAKSKEYKKYHNNILSSLNNMKFKTSGQLRRYIDHTNLYFNFVKANEED